MKKVMLMKVEGVLAKGTKAAKKARGMLFWARLGANLSVLALAATALMADPLWAGELKTKMEAFTKLIRYGSLIIGWGMGFMFATTGVLDLMKKDDDPRAGGKGIKKILGGVALIGLATVIGWAVEEVIGSDADGSVPSDL